MSPRNARFINLFDRFFKSLDTAQSSKIIKVLVPENKSAHSCRMSLISSQLLASGVSVIPFILFFAFKPKASLGFLFGLSTSEID